MVIRWHRWSVGEGFMLLLVTIIMYEVTFVHFGALIKRRKLHEQVCFKVEKKKKQNMFSADAGTSHLLPHV